MSRGLQPYQRKFLESVFPGGDALFGAEELGVFGSDGSRLRADCWAVVRAGETAQVQELLAWAARERMPVYTRARATNMVGNCVPVQGGVVLSTLKMNRILEISAEDFIARVQPGVVTADLARAVAGQGLYFPPDPGSVKFSTVGGNVSTNAGGMRAVRYGVAGQYLLGMEAVLPGGKVLASGGRVHKDVVGYDLCSLFAGSCGTLGVMTELTLKLLPRPGASATALACFADTDQALAGARAVSRAGILPTAMELLTREAIQVAGEVMDAPWPGEAGALLLVKVEGVAGAVEAEAGELRRALGEARPMFLEVGTGAGEEPLWEVRRILSQASFVLGPDKLGEDIAVPRGRVGAALERVRGISRECGVPIVCFGHLGDGNLHVNVMFDAADAGQLEGAHRAAHAVLDLALELEGTVSGEHGTGLAKLEHARKQLGPELGEVMRRIKEVFDPWGIMNPGKEWW